MSADAWTAVSSIATVIGVIAAIVLGVIPLVRDRKKASTAYAPPSTTSGAPQPMPIIVTEAPVSAPAPTAARPVHPAYSPESRRRIGLGGVFWALWPFVMAVLAVTISISVKGQGFNGTLAWLGILVLLLLPVPFVLASIRLRNYKLMLTAVVYGLVSLILWAIFVVEAHTYWTGSFSESSEQKLLGSLVCLLVLGVAATIHAFWLRRRFFARST